MRREPFVTVRVPPRIVDAYQHAPPGQRRTAAGLALADAVVLAKVSAAVVKRAKVDEPIGYALTSKAVAS
jgi:hypothetical protein